MLRTVSTQMRRRRILVGSVGFLVGLSVGVGITLGLYGVYFNATTLAVGALGVAIAFLYAEKRIHLPTADDVSQQRFRERLKPLSSTQEPGTPTEGDRLHSR
jgi:hypothetical protein